MKKGQTELAEKFQAEGHVLQCTLQTLAPTLRELCTTRLVPFLPGELPAKLPTLHT